MANNREIPGQEERQEPPPGEVQLSEGNHHKRCDGGALDPLKPHGQGHAHSTRQGPELSPRAPSFSRDPLDRADEFVPPFSIMDGAGLPGLQRGDSRHVWRAVVSLAAFVGLAYMLLISVVLAAIRCGDSCDGAVVGPEHWQWTAQLVLAAVGSVVGSAALVLGFTSKAHLYRTVLVVSLVCVLAWLLWVLGFGAF